MRWDEMGCELHDGSYTRIYHLAGAVGLVEFASTTLLYMAWEWDVAFGSCCILSNE